MVAQIGCVGGNRTAPARGMTGETAVVASQGGKLSYRSQGRLRAGVEPATSRALARALYGNRTRSGPQSVKCVAAVVG